jgi:hypothetical protein
LDSKEFAVEPSVKHPPRPGLQRSGIPVRVAAVAATLLVASAWGCAESENAAPRFQRGLSNADFFVGVDNQIDLFGEDPDGDAVEFVIESIDPAPASPVGTASGPTIITTGPNQARFVWRPAANDAGPTGRLDYSVTFGLRDGRGGSTRETPVVTVINTGARGRDSITFVEPVGAGVTVELSDSRGVDNLEVRVKADHLPSEQVQIELVQPAPVGAMLLPEGPSKSKRFSWTPTEAQLNESLSHRITFRAREVGGDVPTDKPFLVRFKRNAAAGCPGEPPMIMHEPPSEFRGPLNYSLTIRVTDDLPELKLPPVITWIDAAEGTPRPDDPGAWRTDEFSPMGGDMWSVELPNLRLGEGESRRIYYTIVVTDDDDPDGTACDHSAETPEHSFLVYGGAAPAGQTYGYCEPCVSDDQCGGPDDRCIDLGGGGFCGVACQGGTCGGGQQQCYELESVDAVPTQQCLPLDFNCGQVCAPDMFEGAADNNEDARATPLNAGVFPALSICDGETDWYAVPIQAGQRLRARIDFDAGEGDLDLVAFYPDGANGEAVLRSTSVHNPFEEINERCLPAAGTAYLQVIGYNGASARYDLTVTTEPGDCSDTCEDDRFDGGAGNDVAGNFTAFDLFPVLEQGLQICREDADFYGVAVEAGDLLVAEIRYESANGDLNLRLYRNDMPQPVAESASSGRGFDQIEFEAPVDDIYLIEVYGASPQVENRYDFTVQTLASRPCLETSECPFGEVCDFGLCVDAFCQGAGQCADDTQCIPPLAGRDPASAGGICAVGCQQDSDCREGLGYRCKRLEDFRKVCLPVILEGEAGERCSEHYDCGGDRICFNPQGRGGYCAAGGCDANSPCPAGTVCEFLDSGPACVKSCANDGECRVGEGYGCRPTAAGGMACLP